LLTFFQNLASKEEQIKLQYDGVEGCNSFYISPKCFSVIVNSVMAFLAMLLMIVPVVLLYSINTSKSAKLGIILASVLTFATLCIIITEARRYEIFAATAAYVLDPLLQSLSMLTMVFSYSAVLVVFLGNVQGYQQQK
jgi:hypothetical protein